MASNQTKSLGKILVLMGGLVTAVSICCFAFQAVLRLPPEVDYILRRWLFFGPLALIYGIYRLLVQTARPTKPEPGSCKACGYRLIRGVEHRCPECGREIALTELGSPYGQKKEKL